MTDTHLVNNSTSYKPLLATNQLFGKPTGDSQFLVDEGNNKPFVGEFINNSTYVTDG